MIRPTFRGTGPAWQCAHTVARREIQWKFSREREGSRERANGMEKRVSEELLRAPTEFINFVINRTVHASLCYIKRAPLGVLILRVT